MSRRMTPLVLSVAVSSVLALAGCGSSGGGGGRVDDGGVAGSAGTPDTGSSGAAGSAGSDTDTGGSSGSGAGGSQAQAGSGGMAGGGAGSPPVAGGAGMAGTPVVAGGAGMAGMAGTPAVAGGSGMPAAGAGGETQLPTGINYEEWASSGHADATAEAFNHWNEDDPAEIPTSCAKCHSTPGYQDYLGADGSTEFVVDEAAPIGTVIECEACHNDAASALDQVTFPSGATLTDLGSEARCMTCHQGRESTDSVNERIAQAAQAAAGGAGGAPPLDPDVVSADLGFRNIHYAPAGATLNGGAVRGGYQYDGQSYDRRFRHVPGYDSCVECHDPHTLEVQVSECATCHTGVATLEDLRDIRMDSSLATDYDGDGDTTEGIAGEIETLQSLLLEAIEAYGTQQGNPICYSATSYPYWFIDAAPAGAECGDEDVDGYASWTTRLVQATYNYQLSIKDPGAFAHNAKYAIQLLLDSIADLNEYLTTNVDISDAVREDPGHFNGASEAFRHWDEDEATSASCAKCHGGAEGFSFYLDYGVNIPVEQSNGLDCATCHTDLGDPGNNVVAVDAVTFPGEVEVEGLGDNGLCSTCHSGRESGTTIQAAFATGTPTSFMNVHYLAAGAMKLGTASQVGYEYTGQTYSGAWSHTGGDDCVVCHNPATSEHTFDVNEVFAANGCACHSAAASVGEIRLASSHDSVDFDNDGDATEPLAGELATLAEALLAEIATFTSAGVPICYDGDRYPYWFIDVTPFDASGLCGADDVDGYTPSNDAGAVWTEQLMAAAHNYQLYVKEHGAWAHNFDYMAQLLIDSIEDLGGDVTNYTRPTP